MVAIVGASGAGKSTLLHCIGTLDLPESGSIFYNGQELTRCCRRSSPTSVTGARVRVSVPPSAARVQRPRERDDAGAHPRRPSRKPRRRPRAAARGGRPPHRVDHRPGELSGGEQQRVALARALILSPLLLLADEPTGNLDERTGEAIHELLFGLNQRGVTLIVVTHNRSPADRMPRRLVLQGGLVQERE